jgi:hypothetical protein
MSYRNHLTLSAFPAAVDAIGRTWSVCSLFSCDTSSFPHTSRVFLQLSSSTTTTTKPFTYTTTDQIIEAPPRSKKDNIEPSIQSKMGKKQKRTRQSPDDQHKFEIADRYNKLVHTCSKHLHRDAKIVKSFESQRIVRAIKSAKESLSDVAGNFIDGGEESEATKTKPKTLSRLESLEKKLELTKRLDIESLVQVGLKRLGVLSLGPQVNDDFALDLANSHNKTTESKQGDKSTPPFSQCEEPFYTSLIESMLQHKRLSTSLDQLNEKITEFREWKVSREDRLRGEINQVDDARGGRKRKNTKQDMGNTSFVNSTIVVAGGFNGRKRGLDFGGHEGASGLFIGSLSGVPAEPYTGEYDEEDDFGIDTPQDERKKNRPGQRARRAKATAIEARKSGRSWTSSINWRQKKTVKDDVKRGAVGHDHKSHCGDGSNIKRVEAQHIATMGKTWKEEGNAHPSWAAKAAQKSQGIVKFKGTKITFD